MVKGSLDWARRMGYDEQHIPYPKGAGACRALKKKADSMSIAPSAARGQPHRRTLVAAYYTGFVALGLFAGALGPTLPGLAAQTHARLSEVSLVLTAHGLGYLLGSLLAGRVYDRVVGHRVMAGALLTMFATIALVPFVPWLWVLAGVVLLVAMAEGFLDVGTNTLLVWAFRADVAPAMNGLHLFFGLGSLLAPLIVARMIVLSGDSRLTYLALAPLMLPPAIWLLRLRSPTAPPQDDTATGHVDWRLIALLGLFVLFAVGAEGSFGSWIYTYSTALGLADTLGGAYLTSTYWATFTLGRLLGVAAALRWKPGQILLACMPVGLLSVLAMILWPMSPAVLWAGAVIFGLAIGPVFPAVISLAGRATRLTGQATSIIFVGMSLGMMSMPWVIGQLFDPLGPRATTLMIALNMLLGLIILGSALARARHAASPVTVAPKQNTVGSAG